MFMQKCYILQTHGANQFLCDNMLRFNIPIKLKQARKPVLTILIKGAEYYFH
jgi:hypothetical protein